MKKLTLTALAVLMAVLPGISACADSAKSSDGKVQAGLQFAVRIPERILLTSREINDGQVGVQAASMAGRGSVLSMNVTSDRSNGPTRSVGSGSALNTVVNNDGKSSIYTVALP